MKNGAAHLNIFTTIAGASGGITGCCTAGLLELYCGDDMDPNVYFGTYMSLIILLLLSSIFLRRKKLDESHP